MIELGISRTGPATEVRSGENSYTDLVLAGLLAQQGRGAGAAAEWATGAVQSASALWARCLSVAAAEPELEAVSPDLLGAIGYDLGVVGEHVSVLQVDGSGRVALLRASSWNIAGGADPRSWLYDVSLSGPTGTHTRVVPADGVLHVRYLPDCRTPWRGVAPWKRAPTLSKLSAEVEAALVREARLPTKQIIPMPQGLPAAAETMKDRIQNGNDQVILPPTTAGGMGAGRTSAPLTDWKVTRMKSEPDEGLVQLCRDIPGQIGVLYGIPNVLTSGSGSETQTREAFRRFVLTAVEPLALIVSRELTRVFEVPVELDLAQLAHIDLAGRARAFKAFVASGLSASDAAKLVGVEV